MENHHFWIVLRENSGKAMGVCGFPGWEVMRHPGNWARTPLLKRRKPWRILQ